MINIDSIVRNAIKLASFDDRHDNVEIEYWQSGVLPKVCVDRIQVTQVVLNLIFNGIEAMNESGKADRTLKLEARRHRTDSVELLVSDNGPGIAPEHQDRIFDQFFTTKSNGLGMGLSISRSIVEAHGGHLWLTSTPGQGSVFGLKLPCKTADKAPQKLR